jgi:hypothetical protein
MRTLSKDPLASTKARKEEKRNQEKSGLISIKLGGEGGEKKGGFKKSGFKSAFTPASTGDEVKIDKPEIREDSLVGKKLVVNEGLGVESDTDDEGYEVYDPRYPTD